MNQIARPINAIAVDLTCATAREAIREAFSESLLRKFRKDRARWAVIYFGDQERDETTVCVHASQADLLEEVRITPATLTLRLHRDVHLMPFGSIEFCRAVHEAAAKSGGRIPQ